MGFTLIETFGEQYRDYSKKYLLTFHVYRVMLAKLMILGITRLRLNITLGLYREEKINKLNI